MFCSPAREPDEQGQLRGELPATLALARARVPIRQRVWGGRHGLSRPPVPVLCAPAPESLEEGPPLFGLLEGEFDLLLHAVCTALNLAAGWVVAGYGFLTSGLEYAEGGEADGEPWGPERVHRYRYASEGYAQAFGARPVE